MRHLRPASRTRCVVVAAGLTSALGSGVVALLEAARTGSSATPEEAVVRLCLVALALALGCAWAQGVAGVTDAWRSTPTASGWVRRLAALACGAALAGSLAAPALASTDGPTSDPLAGLPLPDRAEGHAHARPPHVVVRRGDTLWRLAAGQLGPRATARQIEAQWHRLYAVNRSVIGPDPDLIRPGQVLRLSKEQS